MYFEVERMFDMRQKSILVLIIVIPNRPPNAKFEEKKNPQTVLRGYSISLMIWYKLHQKNFLKFVVKMLYVCYQVDEILQNPCTSIPITSNKHSKHRIDIDIKSWYKLLKNNSIYDEQIKNIFCFHKIFRFASVTHFIFDRTLHSVYLPFAPPPHNTTTNQNEYVIFDCEFPKRR